MRFNVQSEKIETYTGKKGEQKSRRLLLLGADADLNEQLCEFNLPAEHPEVGKGKTVTINVTEITAIYAGKPRLRGSLATAK